MMDEDMIPVESNSDDITKEVTWYSSLPAVVDKNEDPLQWWKTHSSSFKRLGGFAGKYLCTPATSVPSERLFSLSGNIVTNKRNALTPDDVNKYCFLAANL